MKLPFLTTNNVKSIYFGASLPAPTIKWFYLFMINHYYTGENIFSPLHFMDLSFYGSIIL